MTKPREFIFKVSMLADNFDEAYDMMMEIIDDAGYGHPWGFALELCPPEGLER